jgi:ribosomal protein S18 acetylase RimI-like enzyme
LIGAQNRAALGVAGIRIEHLRAEWERPHFRLGEDNLVADLGDGRLAGYAAVSPTGGLVLAASDDALADELYARIRDRARGRGDKAIAVTVLSGEGLLASLVRRHPFALDHETLTMWRPLGEPVEDPAPLDGVVIRTFELTDALAVHQLLDEAYLAWDASYVPVSHDGWASSMLGDSDFDPKTWFVAERDGELTGCALHWSTGWLKDIAVRQSERGRGLGSALVQRGLAEFSRRCCTRVGLKVDAGNPTGAIRLYERMGFATTNRQAAWVSIL